MPRATLEEEWAAQKKARSERNKNSAANGSPSDSHPKPATQGNGGPRTSNRDALSMHHVGGLQNVRAAPVTDPTSPSIQAVNEAPAVKSLGHGSAIPTTASSSSHYEGASGRSTGPQTSPGTGIEGYIAAAQRNSSGRSRCVKNVTLTSAILSSLLHPAHRHSALQRGHQRTQVKQQLLSMVP